MNHRDIMENTDTPIEVPAEAEPVAAVSDDEIDKNDLVVTATEAPPAENKNVPPPPAESRNVPPPPPVPKASYPAPAASPKRASAKAKPSPVEGARKEVQNMIEHHELDENDSSALQKVFKENEALKEKVGKLKALLGRSAKAQRETKVEFDATSRKLTAAIKENDKLKAKIEKLATRPTHMELLADFETNFDRALLRSVGQAGGQDTAQPSAGDGASPRIDRSVFDAGDGGGAVVDSMLMQELSESKERIEKLERLNTALVNRSSQMENDLKEAKRSMDELLNKLSRLELEKRMAEMEAESATKAARDKAALLAEMQMEIDMVTKSAQKAAVRAAAGEEMIKTVKSDKALVQQLEAKATALQEWAMASNQAKTLAQERVRLLENQLRHYQQNKGGADGIGSGAPDASSEERILVSKKASMVIGAGDVGIKALSLDPDVIKTVNHLTERVVLRWHFDLTAADVDCSFSILKGPCETAADCNKADALVRDRYVVGGAGGETENAFAIGRGCTMVWSNKKSWVRPRTVKYTLEAVVLRD